VTILQQCLAPKESDSNVRQRASAAVAQLCDFLASNVALIGRFTARPLESIFAINAMVHRGIQQACDKV